MFHPDVYLDDWATYSSGRGHRDHTFQCRLTDEGTSFTGLVDETRRELAQTLSGPPSEIVYGSENLLENIESV
jgi:hypothetical protein